MTYANMSMVEEIKYAPAPDQFESMGDLIAFLGGNNNEDLVQELWVSKGDIYLQYGHKIRGLVAKGRWKELESEIESEKDLPISYKLIGELIMDAVHLPEYEGNSYKQEMIRELACKAFSKIQDVTWRLEMLIGHENWEQAIDAMCKARVTNRFEEQLLKRACDRGQKQVQGLLNRKKIRYNLQ